MDMFAKVIAFFDKAAGVPAWVVHADNIRKLEERGCPTLAKAIVESEVLWPLASYSLEEMIPQIAGMITIGKVVAEDKALGSEGLKQLVHEVVAAYEGPVEGPIEVLQNFVGVPTAAMEIVEVGTLASLAKFAEEVFAVDEQASVAAVESSLAVLENETEVFRGKLQEASADLIQAPLVASMEDLAETVSLTGGLSEEECLATVPGAALDPQVRKQLVQGMMKVISHGRKPGPTLKVLKTMALGDQAAITEALEEMAKQGNRLASAILEDPSL